MKYVSKRGYQPGIDKSRRLREEAKRREARNYKHPKEPSVSEALIAGSIIAFFLIIGIFVCG